MRAPAASFCLTLLVATAFGVPRPQDPVSADDILGNSARYGDDKGKVNPGILNALFGDLKGKTPIKGSLVKPAPQIQKEANYGLPAKTVVDSQDNPCSFYSDAGYRCVPYYQCQNGEIVVDGAGLFDIRSGLGAVTLDPSKSKCLGELEVCCLHPDFERAPPGPAPPPVPIPAPITILPPVPAVPSNPPSGPIPSNPPSGPGPVTPPPVNPPSGAIPSNPPSGPGPINPLPGPGPFKPDNNQGGPYLPLVEPPKPKQYVSRCGQRHYGGIGVRIQNSKEESGTQFGEWPHMCAVLNRTVDDVNLYVCGCSLISDRTVLTAAHCVSHLKAENIKIRAGEWDTQKTIEPQPHQDRFAKHVSVHPGFSSTNLQNDFAVIHLTEPFILAPHIDTACLPDNLNSAASFSPQGCYATGWGKDRFGKAGEYQVIMKKIELDLVPQHVCENQLRATRLGQFFNLDLSFTCAGGKPGKDTCTGDGGGPLVCPRSRVLPNDGESYVQVGIVAWGIGCGEQIPGVYANVSQALCFIDWATRCVEGPNVNLYGFIGCEDWARKEYCVLKDNVALLLDTENSVPPDNFIERGKIRRQRRRLEELLPRYEGAINGCKSGSHDAVCGAANSYGEVDLNPHQRTAEISLAPRTALIEELEVAEGSGDEGSGEESPAEEAPVKESPAEEAPVKESPAVEAPSE